MRRSLLQHLEDYGRSAWYPMHMPGHKRRGESVSPLLPWQLDITEIDGFDDLHDPHGLLREAQLRAAKLYHSQRAWLLVNGSTCGILAAIGACTRPGDAILVARNCHKSVYHAVELWGLHPRFLSPAQSERFPFCGSIPPARVEEALRESPTARAVVVTSPTYEGVISDIAGIATACHRRGVPLIVDEAHGAHLGFSDSFLTGAVRAKADLVIQSLHKTLPSLTQTALLHGSGELVDLQRVCHQLEMFETSSPSYLLMASIDACLRFLEQEGAAHFAAYEKRLCRFTRQCASLRRLTLFTTEVLQSEQGFSCAFDPGKLVIGCQAAAIDGPALAQRLREGYRIEVEMAQPDYLLAMTSLMDSDEGFDRLAAALGEIDRELAERAAPRVSRCFTAIPPAVVPAREALDAAWEQLDWQRAQGRVSAEYLWAYPPGIPWLTPGERIGRDVIDAVRRADEAGIALKSTRSSPRGSIAVLKEAPDDIDSPFDSGYNKPSC